MDVRKPTINNFGFCLFHHRHYRRQTPMTQLATVLTAPLPERIGSYNLLHNFPAETDTNLSGQDLIRE